MDKNKMSNKYILPKQHLSWSALNCWVSNKQRFRKEYFECGQKLDTKYLRFGKGIAELIEKGLHKNILPDLIVYDKPEFEIRTEIQGVPVLSYLDSYDSKNNVLVEYKTGKIPWTQQKVQKHDQLTFYAAALKWATGKMPEYCDLQWIQTKEGPGEVEDFWHTTDKQIKVTGLVKTFHREFDEREIDRIEKIIIKSAEEISEAYSNFIKEI